MEQREETGRKSCTDIRGRGPAAKAKVLPEAEELDVSVTEELQRPEGWRVRDREMWARRPEEVDHALKDLGLTWHCGHHSLCTLEVLGCPPKSSSSHAGSPSPEMAAQQICPPVSSSPLYPLLLP